MKELLSLVPDSLSCLVDELRRSIPFKTKPVAVQEVYVRNALPTSLSTALPFVKPFSDCCSITDQRRRRSFIQDKADFTDPAERTLILCSDVLLIAIPINKNKKTYKLRERVQLVQSWATDTLGKGSERGFSFGTPLRTYHFLASSPEEKTAWFSDIYANILTQKQLLSKGLYKEEPFDPTPEWYFGTFKGNMGWFPASCVHPEGKQQMEPTPEQLHPPTMRTVLSLRQRMVELTGRQILPLSSEGRIAKVSLGDDTSKTLRIADEWPIEDLDRLLELDELPSSVVDFWGKNKDQMKLVIKQTLINTTECSEVMLP
eukprot:Em0020g277a